MERERERDEGGPDEGEGGGPDKGDKTGLVALGVLVVFLVAVVVWALPKDGESGAAPAGSGSAARTTGDAAAPARASASAPSAPADPSGAKRTLERLADASCELFVLTDKPEEKVREVATPEAIGKMLDVRYCGSACDPVRKLLADKERVEIEVSKTADYMLPPKSSFDTVAATLTPAERATIEKKGIGVIVRTHGPSSVDQLPARACFASAAALAEALVGFVYDETLRRIETAPQVVAHAITTPLGQPVFSPKHVVLQLYRQDDGTARILTLGMIRFGSPDFTLRGAPMELGASLSSIANAVAAYAAAARAEAPIVLGIDDVARAAGKKPEELVKDPAARTAVRLASFDHERVEGDPENDMLELLPVGAAQDDDARRDAWLGAVQGLFGAVRMTLPEAGAPP
ncbi:MAG: hypothetical protein JST00_01460 [Deltaproteobacteria bacterium]|nr:hypothetical protein [Deltaproteobacteria bacterium]